MSLIFDAKNITERNKGLTFDDVLLVPQYTDISSRKHPNLKTRLTKSFNIDIPIIASNMDTVSEKKMVIAMAKLGGVAILHRFMTLEEQVIQVGEIKKYFNENNIVSPICASIGVKEDGKKRAQALTEAGVEILTLDIAHGDSIMMLETLAYVKKTCPSVEVIAGNIATHSAVKNLINAGADAVKVGIGPGSMCTTRIITGHGVPQLTAIAMCVEEAKKHNIPVIADGGIRNSGDMVKALGAGANSIMVGSLVSGTLETPGEVKQGKKLYRGMASKSAQVSWRGELPKGMAAEGEATMISCKGSVVDVINELTGGIRSGMTYMGTDSIEKMYTSSQYMEMGMSGMSESRPHGVN